MLNLVIGLCKQIKTSFSRNRSESERISLSKQAFMHFFGFISSVVIINLLT